MVSDNKRFGPRRHLDREDRQRIAAWIEEWDSIDPAYARLCRQELAAYDARRVTRSSRAVLKAIVWDLCDRFKFIGRAVREALRPARSAFYRERLTQIIVTVPQGSEEEIVLGAARILLARRKHRAPDDYVPPLCPSFFREGWIPGQRMIDLKVIQ